MDEEELREELDGFMDRIRENIKCNRQMIEDLPPGTIVRMQGQPDRTREALLELMF